MRTACDFTSTVVVAFRAHNWDARHSITAMTPLPLPRPRSPARILARLSGWAPAVGTKRSGGATRDHSERPDGHLAVAGRRAAPGEGALDAARADGRRLGFDAALALALEEPGAS